MVHAIRIVRCRVLMVQHWLDRILNYHSLVIPFTVPDQSSSKNLRNAFAMLTPS